MADYDPDAACPGCGHRAFVHRSDHGCLGCACRMGAAEVCEKAGSK